MHQRAQERYHLRKDGLIKIDKQPANRRRPTSLWRQVPFNSSINTRFASARNLSQICARMSIYMCVCDYIYIYIYVFGGMYGCINASGAIIIEISIIYWFSADDPLD